MPPRVLASSHPMTAATTCSSTSAPSSAPAWARSMKARSFHSKPRSTACAARPARRTFARCDARPVWDRHGCTGIPKIGNAPSRRHAPRRTSIEARRHPPAGYCVVAFRMTGGPSPRMTLVNSRERSMFSVIFEVHPKPDRWDAYLGLGKMLKPEVEKIDGFVDNIRYRSLRREGWLLSLSAWRDEKALVRWRTQARHHAVQEKGRSEIFLDYHLRIGQLTRDTRPPQGHA